MPKADYVRRVTKVRHVKFQYSPAKVELALNAVSDEMAVAAASEHSKYQEQHCETKYQGNPEGNPDIVDLCRIWPLVVAVFGPLKWKNFVRKYKNENNGQEITKSSIPNALSQLMQDPKMSSNIVSGFKATAVVDHLKYLETKINPTLLEEFKQTNKRNHEWEGKIEAAYLYNVWLELSKDAENSQPKELQEDEPDPNDVTNSLSGSI
ncbi:hypothetical protein JTB14_027762 [Gonioctena quinquepunctata]|nr:hypothetical protein JTB14_027762 [Gonioctena quinquepunctata]